MFLYTRGRENSIGKKTLLTPHFLITPTTFLFFKDIGYTIDNTPYYVPVVCMHARLHNGVRKGVGGSVLTTVLSFSSSLFLCLVHAPSRGLRDPSYQRRYVTPAVL